MFRIPFFSEAFYYFIPFFYDSGSLHQGDGMLIVYDIAPVDKTYEAAVETIHAMNEVSPKCH